MDNAKLDELVEEIIDDVMAEVEGIVQVDPEKDEQEIEIELKNYDQLKEDLKSLLRKHFYEPRFEEEG